MISYDFPNFSPPTANHLLPPAHGARPREGLVPGPLGGAPSGSSMDIRDVYGFPFVVLG